MPRGGASRLRGRRLVGLGAIEGNGGGILRSPRSRHGIHLERVERDSTEDRVELGRQEGIEAGPQAVSMEGGTRSPRLQQRHHPPLFQPFAYLVERMTPGQDGQHQGFDSTAT
jgi:hypothetical protein